MFFKKKLQNVEILQATSTDYNQVKHKIRNKTMTPNIHLSKKDQLLIKKHSSTESKKKIKTKIINL